MSKNLVIELKANLTEKTIERMKETQKGFSFSKKWTDGKGTKDDVVKAMTKIIACCKEMSSSDVFKDETRRRAKELAALASKVKTNAGKLQTSEEQARLEAWQAERFMNLTWRYDTNEAKRSLKKPWKVVPEKKEEGAEEKAPAKRTTTKKTTTKKTTTKKEEAPTKEEAPAKKAPAKKTTNRKTTAKKEEATNESALAEKLAALQAQLDALTQLLK